MIDFDPRRSNAFVVVHSTRGLIRCITAILKNDQAVDAEDVHIYVEKKVPLPRVTEQLQRLSATSDVCMVSPTGDEGVGDDVGDDDALSALLMEAKSPGNTRVFVYARVSAATMRGIHGALSQPGGLSLREMRKAPWASVIFDPA